MIWVTCAILRMMPTDKRGLCAPTVNPSGIPSIRKALHGCDDRGPGARKPTGRLFRQEICRRDKRTPPTETGAR